MKYAIRFKGHRLEWDSDLGEAVQIPIDGYYTEYQPKYEWNFDPDIDKAKLYGSEKAAMKRINGTYGSCVLRAEIIEVKLQVRNKHEGIY